MKDTETLGPKTADYPATDSEYDKPLGDIFKDLSRDAFRLVAQELDLAKLEFSRKVSEVKKNSVNYTIGAGIAYAGFLLILAAAAMALSIVVPMSLAAFLVGMAAMITGLVFMRISRRKMRQEALTSPKAFQALRSDKEWVS